MVTRYPIDCRQNVPCLSCRLGASEAFAAGFSPPGRGGGADSQIPPGREICSLWSFRDDRGTVTTCTGRPRQSQRTETVVLSYAIFVLTGTIVLFACHFRSIVDNEGCVYCHKRECAGVVLSGRSR